MFWVEPAYADKASNFVPVDASTVAKEFDTLYGFLLVISAISCIMVIGGLIVFAIKYRRRGPDDKTAYISHNATLEFLWSFIPFVLFMVVFAWGWHLFHVIRNAPKGAMEIHVEAKKWSWDFVYKNGRRVSSEFYVPLGKPVKMIMSSQDVLHSFYIPGFRVKQDVVPGRYTALWFEATKKGDFKIYCAEYCGDGHSAMKATVHVVSPEDYEDWLQKDPYKGLSMVDVGRKVYESKCNVCHNLSAERKVGPGFLGVFGRMEKFVGGVSLIVDENYVRESILNPNAKIVEGFTPMMPTFAGQLSEQEISGVIEFIKTDK